MSLDCVPGHAKLYLGGLFSLRRYEALKKANITHVVSALRLPPDRELFKAFKHHVVDVDDVEDENIIQHFAASNAFITHGLEDEGAVLVHCAMGKSRSVTLVIAYLLSTLPHNSSNTPDTILSLIRQSRPFAEPNPGFMSQLNLYHAMNMPSTLADLDTHPKYQRWLYHRAVEESNSRGVAPEVDEIRFADTPVPQPQQTSSTANRTSSSSSPPSVTGAASSNTSQNPATSELPARPPEANAPTVISYRCRRCRHQLATSRYIVNHSPKGTITVPTSRTNNNDDNNSNASSNPKPSAAAGRSSSSSSNSEPCAHLFVEPLSWMRPELEQGKVEGRLECPNAKCGGTSVGRYAWQGLKCSCGAWVVPGVSLARGKVDEVKEVEASSSARGIRRPPPLPTTPPLGKM